MPRPAQPLWSILALDRARPASLQDQIVAFFREQGVRPRIEAVSDAHCVTKWSRLDIRWEGVAIGEILKRVRLKPEANFIMVHADPDYTTNVALDDLLADGALLALKADGRDLEPDHGGPCRLVIPHLYFWKSAKWVRGLELRDHDEPGFWEYYGYHNYGDPWKEQRYHGD